MPFSPLLIALLSVIFIEVALSIDNALLLSSFASQLHSKRLQRLSLVAGLLLAFIFRFLLIYYLDIIFSSPLVQILGGSYLIFLAARHLYMLFLKRRKKERTSLMSQNFIFTVLKIEVCDLIFATDSILAAFTLIYSASLPSFALDKVYLIFAGTIMGMILIRCAAIFLLPLMRKQLFLKTSAHMMIGWVGLKMITETVFDPVIMSSPFIQSMFWVGLLLSFFVGLMLKKRSARL